MPEKRKDADLNRDIQRFSMKALELAKAVVDGGAGKDDAQEAKGLAAQLPEFAAAARDLAPAYREGAMKALSEARLDLAYVAANGGIPSSIRLGWYIKDKGEEPGL